jgi:O-acetyl-ADP-ribose deacetylase (regulator of RNase III)
LPFLLFWPRGEYVIRHLLLAKRLPPSEPKSYFLMTPSPVTSAEGSTGPRAAVVHDAGDVPLRDEQPQPQEVSFATLPSDLLILCAAPLQVEAVVALSMASRSLRDALRDENALWLWEELVSRDLGSMAPALARRTASSMRLAGGPSLYQLCVQLRRDVDAQLHVAGGSVTDACGGYEVVACPCLATLDNLGVGAQGAVRRAAGPQLEEALSRVQRPLESLSSTIVPGGSLAPHVAMVVTTPPLPVLSSLLHPNIDELDLLALESSFSERLHFNLFNAVRAAGCLSIALPTLGTGGVGLSARSVCAGLVEALRKDAIAHPRALLRVRVACFEASHAVALQEAKAEMLERLFHDGSTSPSPHYPPCALGGGSSGCAD